MEYHSVPEHSQGRFMTGLLGLWRPLEHGCLASVRRPAVFLLCFLRSLFCCLLLRGLWLAAGGELPHSALWVRLHRGEILETLHVSSFTHPSMDPPPFIPSFLFLHTCLGRSSSRHLSTHIPSFMPWKGLGQNDAETECLCSLFTLPCAGQAKMSVGEKDLDRLSLQSCGRNSREIMALAPCPFALCWAGQDVGGREGPGQAGTGVLPLCMRYLFTRVRPPQPTEHHVIQYTS